MKIRHLRRRVYRKKGGGPHIGLRCKVYCEGCIVCDSWRYRDTYGRFPSLVQAWAWQDCGYQHCLQAPGATNQDRQASVALPGATSLPSQEAFPNESTGLSVQSIMGAQLIRQPIANSLSA